MYKKLTGKEKHKFDFVQYDFELLQTYMNDIIQDKDSKYWSRYLLLIKYAVFNNLSFNSCFVIDNSPYLHYLFNLANNFYVIFKLF